MTAAEMESKLGIRLNHENPEYQYSITERYAFLNEGQLYVVQELPFDMVREVQTFSGAKPVDADGGVALDSLDPLILNGDRGIIDIRHSSGYYCHEITDYDWRRLIEYSLVYNGINPGYRLQGTDVLLKPFTYGTTTGDIQYKAVPTPITSTVNSAFSATVQELIVDYAFYIGLKTGLKFTAAGELLRLVDSQIIDYVNKYTPSRRVIMEAGDGYNRCGRNGQGNIYSR